MSKSETTKSLERNIWNITSKMGTFGCYEVTLGFRGRERIDYLTLDTNGIWRCYEIKSSKSDFNSKCKHTFVGHYNYYVMPKKLYEEVKKNIPKYVGVYSNGYCIKKPKKVKLKTTNEILYKSMIRSLYRDYAKGINSNSIDIINENKKLKNKLRDINYKYQRENIELKKELRFLKRQIKQK